MDLIEVRFPVHSQNRHIVPHVKDLCRHMPAISWHPGNGAFVVQTGVIVREFMTNQYAMPGKHKRFKYETHDIVVYTKIIR